jgi:hypothetical protein
VVHGCFAEMLLPLTHSSFVWQQCPLAHGELYVFIGP